MKTALFGGSFNPVHKEHINILNSAKKELGLDRVIVMPSYSTPNKGGKLTASASDRLNMCRLAFGDKAEISEFEIERGGISYSYITCEEFKKRYPSDERFFIVGADMYENFKYWKNPEEILNCVTLAVCPREKPLKSADIPAVRFSYVGAKISSTKIRTLAALGEDIEEYVGCEVANYIKKNGIYKIERLPEVKKYVSESRWAHIVRVAVFAAENCESFGVTEEKAIIAAAYHDCAKCLPEGDKLLEGCVLPDGVPEAVVHQFTGAFMAEKVFGVKDKDILNAVKYHTTGRANMSALEKLIYLSDMLEEGRNYDGVQELREEFYRDKDACLVSALEGQVKRLGRTIFPLTKEALNYLKENKNDE